MVKSLEARVEELENWMGHNQIGEKNAIDWHWKVRARSSILSWVFRTECERPDKVPKGHPLWHPKGSKERRAAMRSWRVKRLDDWKRGYWSSRWELTTEPGLVYFQGSNDPDLPTEIDSSRLFGYVAAAVPPIAFSWAKNKYRRIMRNYPKGIPLSERSWFDIIDDYLAIETRAKYWRNRIGPQKLSEIELPEWAVRITGRKTVS